jgi:Fe-S cluster assembly protein SufD
MSTAIALRPPAVDHLSTLLAGWPLPAPSPWAPLNALRDQAHAALGALAMPTLRDEAWRFTDLAPLHQHTFEPVRANVHLQPADIAHFFLGEAGTRVVFVDGLYAPGLSRPAVDAGVLVTDLRTALTTHAAALKAHLGHTMALGDNVLPRSIRHSCKTLQCW